MRSTLCLLLLLFVAPYSSLSKPEAKAGTEVFNPETVLLGHFGFARPKAWVWNASEPAKQDILTSVTFAVTDGKARAVILMNLYKIQAESGTLDATTRRMKKWFTEFTETSPAKSVTIGTNKVSFFEYTGSYHGPVAAGKKPQVHHNYTLVGAVLEDGGGNIVMRLYGPTALVEENKTDLKKMIETALKQE